MEKQNGKSKMEYQNGKIYKIVSKQTDKIYIGSTKTTLKNIFSYHKSVYKAFLETNKTTCSSVELLKYDDCEIVLIELYPCDSRKELCRREGELQLASLESTVNKNIAGRTCKEYYIENKDEILEYGAQYYIKNKDEILEYGAQYYIKNKDEIAEQHSKYRIDHKDEILEQNAKYRIDHKDRIRQLASRPFECKCGSIIWIGNKSVHNKTKKHTNYLKSI